MKVLAGIVTVLLQWFRCVDEPSSYMLSYMFVQSMDFAYYCAISDLNIN